MPDATWPPALASAIAFSTLQQAQRPLLGAFAGGRSWTYAQGRHKGPPPRAPTRCQLGPRYVHGGGPRHGHCAAPGSHRKAARRLLGRSVPLADSVSRCIVQLSRGACCSTKTNSLGGDFAFLALLFRVEITIRCPCVDVAAKSRRPSIFIPVARPETRALPARTVVSPRTWQEPRRTCMRAWRETGGGGDAPSHAIGCSGLLIKQEP